MRRLTASPGLFEAPTWDPNSDSVLFSNVIAGGVYRASVSEGVGEVETVVPHRRGIGGLARVREEAGVVVSGRNLALRGAGDRDQVLLEAIDVSPGCRGFNDMTVSPQGSILVGSLGSGSLTADAIATEVEGPSRGQGTGSIVEWKAGTHALRAGDIGHPNGIVLSHNGSVAYVSDSLRRELLRYTIRASGEWEGPDVVRGWASGLPDGLALDAEGNVWVALALAGTIEVLDSGGVVLTAIEVPAKVVTSMCFGRAGDQELFVTTGAHKESEGQAELLRFGAGVEGAAVFDVVM